MTGTTSELSVVPDGPACPICGKASKITPMDFQKFSMPRNLICDECYENGESEKQEDLARKDEQRAQARLKDIRDNYERHAMEAGLEGIHLKADINALRDYPAQRPAVKQVREYLKDEGRRSLTLRGDSGGGKTWLSACVAREWILRGYTVRWIRQVDFLAEVRAGIKSGDGTDSVLKYFRNVPHLILDDVGTESESEFVRETVYNLVDYRQTLQRRSVYTSNMSGSGLGKRYGVNVASRLIGAGPLVHVKGPDLRLS